MDHSSDAVEAATINRRALIGRVGTVAGIAGAGALLGGQTAHAAPGGQNGPLGPSPVGRADATPTATVADYDYLVASGQDFLPMVSTQAYDTTDGRFRFVTAGGAFARLLQTVPAGSLIKEVEMYGTAAVLGVRLDVWSNVITTGVVTQTANVSVGATGDFTLTIKQDIPVTTTSKPTIFAFIPDTASQVWGVRIGYIPPATLKPFPLTNPRVYSSRDSALPKLAANEERVIDLKLPAGARTAVMTLTLTQTEGLTGYVAAFDNGLLTWPGNSSVNWSLPNQDIANTVLVQVTDGKIRIRGGANSTHVIIDVLGYFF